MPFTTLTPGGFILGFPFVGNVSLCDSEGNEQRLDRQKGEEGEGTQKVRKE
jgi:hypothetical protein